MGAKINDLEWLLCNLFQNMYYDVVTYLYRFTFNQLLGTE